MEIKSRSNQELEEISQNFLAEYAAPGSGKYDGRALRIEALIESFGYTIFPIPGLAEIAEAYVPLMPGFIFVDEGQYVDNSFRWRFTMAEELAHILIHRPLFDGKTAQEVRELQELISDRGYQVIEQNAKFLAGCLLMKRDEFVSRFNHFFSIQQQRTRNPLAILRYTIRQLSMDFNVSCYAAALRTRDLGLIDQPQLESLIESFGW